MQHLHLFVQQILSPRCGPIACPLVGSPAPQPAQHNSCPPNWGVFSDWGRVHYFIGPIEAQGPIYGAGNSGWRQRIIRQSPSPGMIKSSTSWMAQTPGPKYESGAEFLPADCLKEQWRISIGDSIPGRWVPQGPQVWQ